MASMDHQQAEREGRRLRACREELAERIARAVPVDGTVEPLKGLYLNRFSSETDPLHRVSEPCFCVIAQGSKEVLLGDTRYCYDPDHYCLATVEMPIVSRIIEASAERPYLSVRLQLDPALVGSVMVETGHLSTRQRGDARAMDVSPLDADMLDAVVRLARLLDTPDDREVLLSLITREIVYRLLKREQGIRLRHLAPLGASTDSIGEAIVRLRREFHHPLRVENLARELGMSVSSFHYHFKAVTGMSPLQFQKQLRLQEARRLMLGDNTDAASAGRQVGYEDPSQFSREYKRLFGQPPMRDVERLRAAVR
jgi:AraC-like DNA-binding protein